MLTKTSVTATRLLIHLATERADRPASLREAAGRLGESRTYLAKVAGQLVKAGIVRAQRGAAGGVTLNRAPSGISLLAIVEACQGAILADFCEDRPHLDQTCAFHQASAELHQATIGVLSRWTLADLVRQPRPTGAAMRRMPCWMLVGGNRKLAARR